MLLRNDARVKLDICRRTHSLCQLREVVCASHLLQLALRLELIGHSKEVDRLLRHREFIHHSIDEAMLLLVEGLLGEILLHLGNLIRFEHQRTEYRLLKLNRLRWHCTDNLRSQLRECCTIFSILEIFCHIFV